MLSQVQYKIRNLDGLHSFAQTLARLLPLPTVLALTGNLGSGKTTFAQHIAQVYGITSPTPSPTFTLVNEYNLPNQGRFIHADLYRLVDSTEISLLGLSDYFNQPQTVVLVEWADRLASLFPPNTLWVRFESIGETERVITVTSQNESSLMPLIYNQKVA